MKAFNFLVWVINWSAVSSPGILYCKDSNPPICISLIIALSILGIGWTSYNGVLRIQEQTDIDKARVERFKTIIGL